MSLNIAPDLETEIKERASTEGITTDELLDRLLHPRRLQDGLEAGEGDFEGKSVYERFSHLFGTASFEPRDLGRRAEEYLAEGFGTPPSAQDAQP